MIFNSITPASGGGSNVNTCTMTIDAGGVTCSNFSDHTPTGEYAVVATGASGEYPLFFFYATSNDQSTLMETFAIGDTANVGWCGYLLDAYNWLMMADGNTTDSGEPMFYLYAGTYTGVVIEP